MQRVAFVALCAFWGAACTGVESLPSEKPVTTYQGVLYLSQPLAEHTVRVYDFNEGRKGGLLATIPTDAAGRFSVDLVAHSGFHLLEAEGPKLPQPLQTVAFVNFDRSAQATLSPISHWATQRLLHLLETGEPLQHAFDTAYADIRVLGDYDALRTLPVALDAATFGEGLRYAIYLHALDDLARRLGMQAGLTAEGSLSVQDIVFPLGIDIRADGVADGRGTTGRIQAKNVWLTQDFLRGDYVIAIARWLESAKNITRFNVADVTPWLKQTAYATGGLFGASTSFFDLSGPALSFDGIFQRQAISGDFGLPCAASDEAGVAKVRLGVQQGETDMSAHLEYQEVPDVPEDMRVALAFLDTTLLEEGDATLLCWGEDRYGNTSEASLRVIVNNDRGDLSVAVTPVATQPARGSDGRTYNRKIIDGTVQIQCNCPDPMTTCQLLEPHPHQTEGLSCETYDSKYECQWDTTRQPYDTEQTISCVAYSEGLAPWRYSDVYHIENFAEGSVTVVASLGYPLRGADVTIVQHGTGDVVGRCEKNGVRTSEGCRTDEQGQISMYIADLKPGYDGYLEIRVENGRFKDLISPEMDLNNTARLRTLIPYEASRDGTNIGTVAVHAETTLAAAVSDARIIDNPTLDIAEVIEETHVLFAQRYTKCHCRNIDDYGEGGPCSLPHGDAVRIAFAAGENDIRRKVPQSPETLGAGLPSILTMVHGAMTIRAIEHKGTAQLSTFDISQEIRALEIDAESGLLDGIDVASERIGTVSDNTIEPEESRYALALALVQWLRRKNIDPRQYYDGEQSLLKSLAYCRNPLFDRDQEPPLLDFEAPVITAEATPSVIRQPRASFKVTTSDRDSGVHRVEIRLRKGSNIHMEEPELSPSGTFRREFELPWGCNTTTSVELTAYDLLGNHATTALSIVCDDQPPPMPAMIETHYQDMTDAELRYVNGQFAPRWGNALSKVNKQVFPANFALLLDRANNTEWVPTLKFKAPTTTRDNEVAVLQYRFYLRSSSAITAMPSPGTSTPIEAISRCRINGSNLLSCKEPQDGWSSWRTATSATDGFVVIPLTLDTLCRGEESCLRRLLRSTARHSVQIRVVDDLGNATVPETYDFSMRFRVPPLYVHHVLPDPSLALYSLTDGSLRNFYTVGAHPIGTIKVDWTAFSALPENLRRVHFDVSGMVLHSEISALKLVTGDFGPIREGPLGRQRITSHSEHRCQDLCANCSNNRAFQLMITSGSWAGQPCYEGTYNPTQHEVAEPTAFVRLLSSHEVRATRSLGDTPTKTVVLRPGSNTLTLFAHNPVLRGGNGAFSFRRGQHSYLWDGPYSGPRQVREIWLSWYHPDTDRPFHREYWVKERTASITPEISEVIVMLMHPNHQTRPLRAYHDVFGEIDVQMELPTLESVGAERFLHIRPVLGHAFH